MKPAARVPGGLVETRSSGRLILYLVVDSVKMLHVAVIQSCLLIV
jgi:hypothetical protein